MNLSKKLDILTLPFLSNKTLRRIFYEKNEQKKLDDMHTYFFSCI